MSIHDIPKEIDWINPNVLCPLKIRNVHKYNFLSNTFYLSTLVVTLTGLLQILMGRIEDRDGTVPSVKVHPIDPLIPTLCEML